MSWKVSCVMDERLRFIGEATKGTDSMTSLCTKYGISRKTGYKWLERYRREGLDGLKERSRAPHHQPHAVCGEVIQAILARRDRKPTEGPLKIRVHLQRVHPQLPCPSSSTIAEILKTHGRVKRRRRRNPAGIAAPAQPLAGYTHPNAAWCADFKGWFRVRNGAKCTPLTISDAHSRFLLVCQGLHAGLGFTDVRPLFETAFREYGMPEVIRTDNGAPFGSTGIGGLSRLSVWFLQLAIRPEHIRPAHPQDNGRHERMHRTLKEATAKPPHASLRAQQRAFDRFRAYYNDERPHQALGQVPPAAVYRNSNRPFPKRLLTPEYPREWKVRKVKHKGGIMWNGHELFIGQALTGCHVGLKPVDDDCWLIYFFDMPLLMLDEPELRIRPYRGQTEK